MTDRLTELLEHTADAWSQGPAPTAPDVRPRRGRSWLAPTLAAAACVAVALAAAGLSTRSGPAEPATAGKSAAIPVDRADHPRDGDAGLPEAIAPLPERPRGPSTQGVRARFADSRLLLTTTGPSCRLPDGVVPFGGALRVRLLQQPDVPNSPDFLDQLDDRGLALSAVWSGACPEPGSLLLIAPGWVGPAVEVSGTPAGCAGTADPELVLGPPHRVGTPGGVVPADRAGLQLVLTPPASAVVGGRFTYLLSVRNPTSASIPLRPCPTFTVDVSTGKAGGFGGRAGRFPCERLPQALAPGAEAVLELAEQLPSPVAGTGPDRATLTLTIAGAAKATTSFPLAAPVVTERVTIPYAAPPPAYIAPAVPRVQQRIGAMPIQISAPTSVRAGDVLRYRAVLTLPADEELSLSPCPGWRESLYPAPGGLGPPGKLTTRTGPVTCAQAPANLEPGSEVTFEMELPLPSALAPGRYQLVWQLNGYDSAPFDFRIAAQ